MKIHLETEKSNTQTDINYDIQSTEDIWREAFSKLYKMCCMFSRYNNLDQLHT